MFLLKDTTQWGWWGSHPRSFGLESSTLPLSHCAPCTSFVDLLCFFLSCVCYTFVIVCLYVPCGHLLGRADCEFVTFPLVSWVRCGTWLYRFLIFAPLLTLRLVYHLSIWHTEWVVDILLKKHTRKKTKTKKKQTKKKQKKKQQTDKYCWYYNNYFDNEKRENMHLVINESSLT